MWQAKEATLVKLGGSVITDKTQPFTEKMDAIKRLAHEIHSSRTKTHIKLIVGHGGGSYPHTIAYRYQTFKGLINERSYLGIALVQDAAARLNRIVIKALIDAGENAISVQPSAGALAENSRIIRWDVKIVEKMLEHGLLPVVYGDVCLDLKQGCCILSTEEIFRYLATKINVNRVVIGSDVNGVYDRDPKIFPNARKIPTITVESIDRVLPSLKGADAMDVTGGMRSKVITLLELASEADVECEIIDITTPGLLEEALDGKRGIGTIVKAK